MAIPRTLHPIARDRAMGIIGRKLKDGTGRWEGGPLVSDFVYGTAPRVTIIRPPSYMGEWETGRAAL